MGTELKMILYAENESKSAFAISAVLEELDDRSKPINNYNPASEVSRLAGLESGRSLTLSRELSEVLLASKRWHELSHGAFDVTAGASLELWSRARKQKMLPRDPEIRQAMQHSGWERVILTNAGSPPVTVTLLSPRVTINVSGIATGYLLDLAMTKLRSQGIESALIDIGGDIIVSNPPPNAEAWTVDIAGLDPKDPIQKRFSLRNQAVTTSGDLNQFTEIEGDRYSHLIDPLTGRPIPHRISVTVVAQHAIDADAGATSIAALGCERTKLIIDSLPIDSVFIAQREASKGTEPEKSPISFQWSKIKPDTNRLKNSNP